MNIIHITPGAGRMFCGGCLRDNALVRSLRAMGHSTVMIPLYLPLTLDEEDESRGTPIFYGGVSVYLEEKIPFLRRMPGWMRRTLAAPALLRIASGKAAKTRPESTGGLTVSMLRGEEGHQAAELEELIAWLKTQPKPDVIALSNAMLAGLARELKARLGAPVVCTLQGEDGFLDALPEPDRSEAWKILSQRAADIDLFIAPSRYFGELMGKRLHLPPEKVEVIYNGINVDGFHPAPTHESSGAKVLGFFARMSREKGLDSLVRAFISLKPKHRALRLKVGGSCGPADEPLVNTLRRELESKGMLDDAEFFPNVDLPGKQRFFNSLTVFSAPALYGEAFGLYVLEALASGVPVVQPRHAAFPEVVEATGGGLLYDPSDPSQLAARIDELLSDPARATMLGQTGRRVVLERFTVERMARETARAFERVSATRPPRSFSVANPGMRT